jgi:hypothetical protein
LIFVVVVVVVFYFKKKILNLKKETETNKKEIRKLS